MLFKIVRKGLPFIQRVQRLSTPHSSSFGGEGDSVKELLRGASSPDERIFSENQEPFLSNTYVDSGRKDNSIDESKSRKPYEEDHSHNSSILFPGQGMQYPGMGSILFDKEKEVPIIGSLFDRASHLLNYDLKKLCLEASQEELDKTVHCQPATFVSSLASVEYLYSTSPDSVRNCISTAGFSVGELAALVFSGAISFEDGVRLVKVRAEEMQRCSEIEESGMMTVFYGANNEVGLALKVAQKWLKEKHDIKKPVVTIANYLYSQSKVIAGHKKALDFIDANKEDFKIRKTKRIPVSGAFHTTLMQDALPLFKEQLAQTQIHVPKIPVFANIDGQIYSSPNDIRKKLPKQIISPVKWEQTINSMYKYTNPEHIPSVIECGPGKSLSYILRKINGKIARKASNVSV
ncbi:probable malonyl-CoA-acyl carrier protein transacylase, mitochondrial [Lepeophtheirus salmonis]|uniref:probable malonyl-CoA-acyl carrier protein transacylase, mitochondrial n=1 Tax=Lepeophtheirus salmonis TaxID=72036 RepID=UPI001AE83082|nr:probable malonyl-CoA-acyl carrier protein transacylase, mitochondrial [Lepeophtheirus salmonis]